MDHHLIHLGDLKSWLHGLKIIPCVFTALKLSDLRKGVVEVLSPEGVEREKSVSGSYLLSVLHGVFI